MNDRPKLPSLRNKPATIDMVRNMGGVFDAEAWHVIEKRDNQLIEDEILHGAGSANFVYSFKIKGKEVAGVSVIGARHLASHYGGLKHRIVGSIQKSGALHTFTSYPSEQMPMAVSVAQIPDLRSEPDYYAVLVEVTDLKTGNTIQVEQRETRFESRDDGSQWEKPHFAKIAQSKAYRNAILDLIPQDVVLKWKLEMLKLQKGEVITESVIEQKRKGVLKYAAAQGIPLLRSAVNDLAMEQIDGLAEAARTKDRVQFTAALGGLNLTPQEETVAEDQSPKEQQPAQGRQQARKEEPPRTQGGGAEKDGEEGKGAKAQGKPAEAGSGDVKKRPNLFRDEE